MQRRRHVSLIILSASLSTSDLVTLVSSK